MGQKKVELSSDELRNQFIIKLGRMKVKHYVCNRCGFTEGHQMIWCPKCPGRMRWLEETEFDVFLRNREKMSGIDDVKYASCYRSIYSKLKRLPGGYINPSDPDWDEWERFVNAV